MAHSLLVLFTLCCGRAEYGVPSLMQKYLQLKLKKNTTNRTTNSILFANKILKACTTYVETLICKYDTFVGLFEQPQNTGIPGKKGDHGGGRRGWGEEMHRKLLQHYICVQVHPNQNILHISAQIFSYKIVFPPPQINYYYLGTIFIVTRLLTYRFNIIQNMKKKP